MNYKKIIKKAETRSKILSMLNWVPSKVMLKLQYRIKLKRKLNLRRPERFTEKIQWYKINYRNPIMHQCVDKYAVREFVKNKGLGDILNKCYGIYSSENEIDFDELPNKFVIKATSGGGGVNIIICNDKASLNVDNTKKIINSWLRTRKKVKKSSGREWAYETNENKIIIEKLLEGNDENLSGINDYKFFCYNGNVEYIVFDGDRYVKHKRNFYDKDWNYIDVISDCEALGDIIEKPKNLQEMIQIAEKLSEDFPFVRVDLYSIAGKITFGELTFYPWSGYVQYSPDEFDKELGKKFVIDGIDVNG